MSTMEFLRQDSRSVLTVVAAALAGTVVLAGVAYPGDLVVCRVGVPALPIIAGTVSEPVVTLQRYLDRITGGSFQVRTEEPARGGIYVGLAADFPQLSFGDVEKLGPEGFILRSDAQNLYLVAAGPLGVRHAVTTFLQKLGCRWFFPGSAWEVVPALKTVAGRWSERQRPSFRHQRSIWYGFGAYPRNREEKAAWDRRNRMGGPVPISIGHTWHGLDPRGDFQKHPEWFALTQGERKPTKPCYSHPEVIKRAVEYAREHAARGTIVISMSPPDGLGYCECTRCRSVFQGATPFRSHSTLFATRPDGVVVNITSETLFRLVNEVAKAVAADYPDRVIGCYAYSAYSHPPSFALQPNVFLQTSTSFRRTMLSREDQIAAFGRKTAQLGIREYYSVYQWDWDYPAVAKGSLFLPKLVEDLRYYHENGVTAINAEASNNWGPRGLGYYVAAHLLWDVGADVKAIIRDFYEKAFGPAARPMERYYVRWYGPFAAVSEEAAASDAADLSVRVAFSGETLKASFRDLDEAARLVAELPDYRRRVDHLRLYNYYLFLRLELEEAARSGERNAVVRAIEAETILGARLMNTNMIHAWPLIGKAFHRRFRPYMKYLAGRPEGQDAAGWGKGFRKPRDDVPSREELQTLWDRAERLMSLPPNRRLERGGDVPGQE